MFGAVMDLHCLFISFNKDIFKITADNFINRIMMSLKEDMLLFQQQEKSFLCYFSPSNSPFFISKHGKNPQCILKSKIKMTSHKG